MVMIAQELHGRQRRPEMEDERFNMSLRKFLKHVGVTSQQEIERVVREKNLSGGKLHVRAVLNAEGTDLHHVIEGEIDLPEVKS
jgi:phosphoserine phosphatase